MRADRRAARKPAPRAATRSPPRDAWRRADPQALQVPNPDTTQREVQRAAQCVQCCSTLFELNHPEPDSHVGVRLRCLENCKEGGVSLDQCIFFDAAPPGSPSSPPLQPPLSSPPLRSALRLPFLPSGQRLKRSSSRGVLLPQQAGPRDSRPLSRRDKVAPYTQGWNCGDGGQKADDEPLPGDVYGPDGDARQPSSPQHKTLENSSSASQAGGGSGSRHGGDRPFVQVPLVKQPPDVITA